MATLKTGKFRTISPSQADVDFARQANQSLARGPKQFGKRVRFAPRPQGVKPIPHPVRGSLRVILSEIAAGNTVTLIPAQARLTDQQAAELLGVSRLYLIGLLDQGLIPSRGIGRHRRVAFQEVLAYKRRTDAARLETLAELSALDQELHLGY